MNSTPRTVFVLTVIAALALAGLFSISQPATPRLTYRQVAELTAPSSSPAARNYTIQLVPFGVVVMNAAKPSDEGELINVQSLPYPTDYHPQQELSASPNGGQIISPIIPTNFATAELGWRIRFTAKPFGKLVEVSGEADHLDGQMVNGGYGEIVGQLYDDQGHPLAPNKLDQPITQTTTTRFHVFALPGKPYEVTLYHGTQSEKHILIVKAQ